MEFEFRDAEKAFTNNKQNLWRRRFSREMAVILVIVVSLLLLFPAVVMGSQMFYDGADRSESGFYYGITSEQGMPGTENPENMKRMVRLAQQGAPMDMLLALMRTTSADPAGTTGFSGNNAVDSQVPIPENGEDEEHLQENVENTGAAVTQGQNGNGQGMPGGAVSKMAFRQAERMFWPDATIFYLFACAIIVAASLKIILTEYRRNQKKHKRVGREVRDE